MITFSAGGATMEMIHASASDRIIQRFEWTWDNREIWLDGRKVPNVDEYLPRFNGFDREAGRRHARRHLNGIR